MSFTNSEGFPKPTEMRLLRRIQKWSWAKINSAERSGGTVAEAAEVFKKDPVYIRNLIGPAGPGNYFFYWQGPDDDFSKQELCHDGE
jgi:hypothetical protein